MQPENSEERADKEITSACGHQVDINVTFNAPTESQCTERRTCSGQVMRIEITDNTTSNEDITNTTFINKPRDVPLFDIKISDILCECESFFFF